MYQNALYRWTTNAAFRAFPCHQLHVFVGLKRSKATHQDFQASRIRRDLDDVQAVSDFLTGSLVNSAEGEDLVSLSIGCPWKPDC